MNRLEESQIRLARANLGFKIAVCGFLLATLARLPMTLVSGPPYPQWTLIVVVVMALGASVLAIAGVIIAVSAKFER